MPKRDRSGELSRPGRVVAPIKVKGRISITWVRAARRWLRTLAIAKFE